MKQTGFWLGALAVAGFLWLTSPANRSEAEDAYFHASRVESPESARFFHQHHLLYLPVGRALYRGAQGLGYRGRGLEFLSLWSRLSAALCVALLARLLRREDREGWPWALAMLGSYGFWRYAVEAEIYLPMLAPALGALVAIRSPRRSAVLWAGLLLTAAALLHLAAFAAVGAVAAYLWIRGRRRAGIALGVAVPAIVLGLTFWISLRAPVPVYRDAATVRPNLLQPAVLAKGAGVAGHAILSGNFLWAWPTVATRIEQAFPHRLLGEELFMGRRAPAGTVAIAAVTLLSVLALAGLGGVGWIRRRRKTVSQEDPDPGDRRALGGAGAVWLGLSVFAALRTEADNIEMWIPALPAVWLLAGWMWNRAPASGRSAAGPWLLAIAILAHNWFGGMRLLQDARGDYLSQKAAALMDVVKPGDWVLTADSYVFATYLEYQTGATILDAKFLDEETFDERQRTAPGARVWIFEDVWDPPAAVWNRRPEDVARLRTFGAALRPRVRRIGDTPLGGLYELAAEPIPEERLPVGSLD
ncbi:MAG: hypothetical protein U1E27_06565 [Kiritimatiellia bacterium]|nr:hypothetical protein [Kiritimatiellia bacterium]